MAIFDEIGRKITNAGQGVAQSTKNFADITKLNGMISETEKKIGSLYSQLGQTFFEANKTAPAEPYSGMFSEISKQIENVSTYKDQIKKIKGVIDCPNCGAEVPYGSSFCNTCGMKIANLPSIQDTSTVLCKKCGNEMPEGYKFCTVCGTAISMEVSEENTDTTDNDAIAEENQFKIVCPNCGKELFTDALFCTGCGQKL